jgi:hypothetical protein
MRKPTVVLIEFDQNTLANMTAALEKVSAKIPADKDSAELRKQIATAIIACAKDGKRSYEDFEDAGDAALRRVVPADRPAWLSWLSARRRGAAVR